MHFLLARQPTKKGAAVGVLAVRLCGKPTLIAVRTLTLDFCKCVNTSVNAQAGKINILESK